jgi:tRNA nucleotidyltransferase (CCA-adding enzyme)
MFKTGSFIRLHQYLSHYWAVILSTLFESTEIPVKVSDETLKSLLYSKDDLILRLALVFRDYDAEVADVMKSLRFDNATIKDVYNLVCRKENYKYVLLDDQDDFGYITRRYIAMLGYDQTERLLDYWQAIVTVKYNLARFTYLSSIEEMRKQVAETREKKFCCTVKDLDITGDDLIQIGFKQGDSIGKVLNILLDKVLKMPFMNKKNWLIEWARKSKEDQAIMQDSN